MTAVRTRLILVDDHHMVVEGLRAMLQRKFTVVAVAYSAAELLDLLPRVSADCLLLDLSLPDRNGLDLMPDIIATAPELRVLVVTMHLDRVLAEAARDAGARAFVPKDSSLDELEEAIRRVMAGETFVSPHVPKHTDHMGFGASHPLLAPLTPRQHELLQLLAPGRPTAELARELELSERTVGFHRMNIREKLGLDSEQTLLKFAVLARGGMPMDADPPVGPESTVPL